MKNQNKKYRIDFWRITPVVGLYLILLGVFGIFNLEKWYCVLAVGYTIFICFFVLNYLMTYVQLDEDGFFYRNLLGKKKIKFQDIKQLNIVSAGRSFFAIWIQVTYEEKKMCNIDSSNRKIKEFLEILMVRVEQDCITVAMREYMKKPSVMKQIGENFRVLFSKLMACIWFGAIFFSLWLGIKGK